MRRVLSAIVLLAVVCGWTAASHASEVVEFADGRFLEVQSHLDEGYYIRLVVDRDSFMIIPASKIDEIRQNQRVVYSYDADQEPAAGWSAARDRGDTDRPDRVAG